MPELLPDQTRAFDGPEGTSHVAYYGADDAPPVVLLHSGGMSGKQWRRAVFELRGVFRVVVPDVLGMGQSPAWPAEQPFAYSQDVAQLLALLATLGAPAHLVGHSYGGLLALRAAQHTTVRSLALYEPAAFGVLAAAGDAAFEDVWGLSQHHRQQPRRGVAWQDDWLRSFVDFWNQRGSWDALSDDARREYARVHHKLEREVDSLLADHAPASSFASITAPTVLMAGERSPRAARRVVDALHAVMPEAALELFALAGHLGPLTHARRVAARIRDHLERC